MPYLRFVSNPDENWLVFTTSPIANNACRSQQRAPLRLSTYRFWKKPSLTIYRKLRA